MAVQFSKIDLHLHSTRSDGSDTPEQLLIKVRQHGMKCFALTDHDAIDGCRLIKEMLVPGDPMFIPGIELGCKYHVSTNRSPQENEFLKGKYHILGYQFNIANPVMQDMVQEAHDIRMEKMMDRFHFLTEEYNYHFSQSVIDKMAKLANPGKPHFAAMMVDTHLADSKDEAFHQLEKYPGFFRVIAPEKAIESILQAQGIPVLAHAPYGDGGQHLSKAQIRARVAFLKECGLMGLECYYSSYDISTRKFMLSLAKEFDLLVTCGSDYHGTVKFVKLGENCAPDEKLLEPFLQLVQTKQKESVDQPS